MLEDLLPKIDSLSEFDPEEIENVCSEIHELLDRVDHHDKQEIDLLQESMWFDEGGEGWPGERRQDSEQEFQAGRNCR